MKYNLKKTIAVLVLLALIGSALTFGGINVWAWGQKNQAKECLEIGDYRQAKVHLERCLSIWPKNGEAHFLMARTCRRLGHFDEALEHLKRCEELEWSEEGIMLESTLRLAQLGEFVELEGQLQVWAQEDTADAAVVCEVISMHYVHHLQVSKAMFWGERFLKFAPRNVNAMLGLARMYDSTHDKENSLKHYRQAVQTDPDSDLARKAYADALQRNLDFKTALFHFEKLRAKSPDDQNILLGIVRCHRGMGKLEKGKDLLDSLVTKYPNDPEILIECGQYAYRAKKPEVAEKWFKKAVKIKPYDGTALYQLYLCVRQQGPKKQAEGDRYYKQHQQLTASLKRLDDLVRNGMTAEPNNPAVPYEIGMLLVKVGEGKTGVDWLQRAVKMKWTFVPAHRALADYYEKAGKKEQAAKHRHAAEGGS